MTSSLNKESAVFGLILVGGKSSRMKQPKAHLAIHELPQWQHLERVLAPFCEAVYFSVSPQLWPPLNVPRERLIDDVFHEPIGPLGGIISAFRKFPDATFFVLACDLPNFDNDAVSSLMKQRNPSAPGTFYVHEGKLEPLCGIYEPSIKTELARAWAENRLCPRGILAKLDVEKVLAPQKAWFANLNHPEDLVAVRGQALQNVTVYYYASLREQAGRAQETLCTTTQTVGALFTELKARYGFALEASSMRFAINDALVSQDAPLPDHAHVVFIPPVSGG